MSDWVKGLEASLRFRRPKDSFTASELAVKLGISTRNARDKCLTAFKSGILDRVEHSPIGKTGLNSTYYYFDKKPTKSKT